MQANEQFLNQSHHFWANVRSISESLGYTQRQTRQIRVYTWADMQTAAHKIGLSAQHLGSSEMPSQLARRLQAYFEHQATVLNDYVEPRLMDVARAQQVFDELKASLQPTCPLPMNKQKADKKTYAYFTGIINMLIEAHLQGLPCDFEPRQLTSFVADGVLWRTLARRLDGCFPSCVNPLAVWEIKEYYYTTTFGSRVADGVYETMLDGYELQDLQQEGGAKPFHLLAIDAYETWWNLGRSYLCRLVDILHMGYVDEILFGYEVIERLPTLVESWRQGFYEQ